jgi:hypothetical protein
MGMCMCTMLGCPIGLAVGSGATCCAAPLVQQVPRIVLRNGVEVTELLFFAAFFLATFVCFYLPLTILCARATRAANSSSRNDSSNSWELFPSDGECWSEGGSMPYTDLGLWTGFIMGFALLGLITSTVRVLYRFYVHREGVSTGASTTIYQRAEMV